jgi:tRNA(fMet)-specific endonuclease VapC
MYMLDTDTCSYVLKTKSKRLRKKFESETGNIAISEIVLAELRFGAENHPSRTGEIHDLIDDFSLRLNVIPWAASSIYGALRAHLKQSGTPIGNLDTLIAAHALQQQLILVTNNTRHFNLVPGLKIVNWL